MNLRVNLTKRVMTGEEKGSADAKLITPDDGPFCYDLYKDSK
jgi:hypothetical protein